jgi:hypothetical protein
LIRSSDVAMIAKSFETLVYCTEHCEIISSYMLIEEYVILPITNPSPMFPAAEHSHAVRIESLGMEHQPDDDRVVEGKEG